VFLFITKVLTYFYYSIVLGQGLCGDTEERESAFELFFSLAYLLLTAGRILTISWVFSYIFFPFFLPIGTAHLLQVIYVCVDFISFSQCGNIGRRGSGWRGIG